ncbi:uncharacterized protein Asalp_10880 [Aeromonas salmonicida subsp. pectinolytica 34mel]|uniref:Uncharacterized protein n=1 Tax=Aeromonas salmonicida subsp. pectinolytica 34mel TaxID=1324960 RepID=T0R3F5_AERSA|nr:uncharacterized protein Asalp_10880 [Aeromonas salmonicida subsp. pectinolytica 34mel]EQC05868.1 hypothetical protein K931_03351 [Aeromonas salmonicida subsp. pectinolytica 34mel]
MTLIKQAFMTNNASFLLVSLLNQETSSSFDYQAACRLYQC